jgi:hypothetical protein
VLSGELFRTRVERRVGELFVLGPPRQEPPAHHLWNALVALGANSNEHRLGRWLVPIGVKVRRGSVEVKLQLDLDLGIVRREANASTHAWYVGSLGLIPTRPMAAPSSFTGVEFLPAEPLLEFLGIGRI